LNTKEKSQSKETNREAERERDRGRERERDRAAVVNLFIKYKKAQIVSMNLCMYANILV